MFSTATTTTANSRKESETRLFMKAHSKMNKIQRRPKLTGGAGGGGGDYGNNGNGNRGGGGGGGGSINQVGMFETCFNLVVSPSLDSYWADCLRYVCSVEKRSQYRTSTNVSTRRNNCVPVVQVSQPNNPHHLPGLMSTSSGTRLANSRQHKPRVVLSFLRWEQRDRDMRGLLAQVLTTDAHFSEGHVLSAIEADAGEEMGEPLVWYPVAHMRGARIPAGGTHPLHHHTNPTHPNPRQEKRVIGGHFTLIQDTYYEHTKLTLMLNKNNNNGGGGATDSATTGAAAAAAGGGGGRTRNLLMLAYRSLEDVTDPGLLEGWVRWSGAWEAYTLLQEKKLRVPSISLYIRDTPPPAPTTTTTTVTTTTIRRRRLPRESFKYVVVVEVATEGHTQEQQLRAATQRLRVERWSGYIGLYSLHTLQDFAESVVSNDSISRMVADL